MRTSYRRILATLPAIAIMIAIFLFSAQTAAKSNQSSDWVVGNVVDAINQMRDEAIHISDQTIHVMTFIVRKLAHTLEYAGLGFWICFAIYENGVKGKKLGFAILISFVYACTDELHQKFVPGRSCEFRDVLIDTNGAFLGYLFFLLSLRIIHRIRSKKGKDTAQ